MRRILLGVAIALVGGWAFALDSDFLFTTNGTTVKITRNPAVEVKNEMTISQSFSDPAVVRKVEMAFGSLVPVVYQPTQRPVLPDGLEIMSGQLRIANQTCLGEGTVVLGSKSAPGQLVFTGAGRHEIENQVVFANQSSVVVPINSACPVLKRVATTNGVTMPLLGRESGNCSMGLALPEDSVAMDGFSLRGALQPFTLEGTLRLAAVSTSPRVFEYVGSAVDLAKCQFRTTEVPLTYEVAENVERVVDLPFECFGMQEIAVAPANNSFEEGETGWNLTKMSGAGDKVGVKQNGEKTWVPSSTQTSYGRNFYTMRCLHKLTSGTSISLKAGSDWHVKFAAATREVYYSYKIEVTVRLIGTDKKTYSAVLPARSDYHGFTDYTVGPFDIPDGDYYVELETSRPVEDSNKWSALSVDNIRVVTTGSYETQLDKKGLGALALRNHKIKGSQVTVREGELRLDDCELNGTRVTVRRDGCLRLEGNPTLGAGGVDVEVGEGGCLTFVDSVNRVSNPSFEAGVAAGDSFVNKAPAGWTLHKVFSNAGNGNGSGYQRNGGSVTPARENGPYTTAGEITAYLRIGYSLSQPLLVPAAGTYRLSFVRARRRKYDVAYDWTRFHLKVLVNGEPIEGGEDVSLSPDYERLETDLELPEGVSTLAFETYGENAENGPMCFIDDVNLSRVVPIGEIDEKVRVGLSSGSILQLDNLSPIRLKRPLEIDGVSVRGGRSAIQRAGVIVRGAGKISSGAPLGMVIVFR